MDRNLSYAVKQRVVQAAVMLLTKSGCEVTETKHADGITLDVFIPPDSTDVHGDNLRAVLSA